MKMASSRHFTELTKGSSMHPNLTLFIRQYVGIVCAALLPVIATAFLTIPLSLGAHPGEHQAPDVAMVAPVDRHMS
jgi:hypothetical protein